MSKTGRIQDGSHEAQVPWPLSRLWHNPHGTGARALFLLTRDHRCVAPARIDPRLPWILGSGREDALDMQETVPDGMAE